MSRSIKLACLAFTLITALFLSCQKELSFEQGSPSVGSLRSVANDCLPKVVKGTYKASQALADSNYIDVTVDVTQAGTYTIKTDTVNGYYFLASGTFSAAGPTTVRLKGGGTPAAAGTDNFIVVYDTSFCFVDVTVLPSGSSSGGSAAFTLAGAGGGCTNFNVAGTYTQGTPVTAANTVSLNVNVTTIGSWTLSTNTVAGFSYTGSGNFTATGNQTITLVASGTPTANGAQTFSVTAGAGTCTFAVTVANNTAPGAVFALAGAPNACSTPNIQGSYVQGTALTTSNTVTLNVNVTTAGPWIVTTNTVAGMTFGGAGTFSATGPQTIVLTGTGTPSATGAQTLSVTAGSSTCTFPITVTGAVQANTDHLPLTPNSYWTYNDPQTAGDTLKRINDGTITIGANTYRVITENDNAGDPVWEYYFRKSGNNYYEYSTVHDYSILTFADPVPEGEMLFLKEGLTTGTTWLSSEFSGTDDNTGAPTKLRYSYTCTDANANGVVVNGKTFNNVYKITWKSQTSVNNAAFADEGLVWESWYAQGVGLIYMKGAFGTASIEWKIRFWQIQ